MNTTQNTKLVNSIEEQLSAICMSARMSSEALHDARLAGRFLDAIAWVCNQAQRVGAGVFAKPSPKY